MCPLLTSRAPPIHILKDMMNMMMIGKKTFKFLSVLIVLGALTACAQVPQEAVELSTTVGRDLEEVHRAHKALAESFFDRMEQDADQFIDDTYAPMLISGFVKDFKLEQVIVKVVKNDPKKLVPILERFISNIHKDIEGYRTDIKSGIIADKKNVLKEINNSHKNLQAANAIVTGHLASVRNVHDMQNELLAKVKMGDLREKIGTKIAKTSSQVSDLVRKGQKAHRDLEKLQNKKEASADQLKKAKAKIEEIFSNIKNSVK